MFTLDELRGLKALLAATDELRRVREVLGVPMGTDQLRDFYALATRVLENLRDAEKAEAEKEKAKK